jgi:hypothetical protein
MARKRTSIKVTTKKATADILTLSIDDMRVDNGTGKSFNLKRLRYLNVPALTAKREWKKPNSLINAGRDEVIRELFDLCKADKKSAFTAFTNGSVAYFKYLDSIGYSCDIFAIEIMSKCLKHYNSLAKKGLEPIKAKMISDFLSFFLKKMGRNNDAKELPIVKTPAFNVKNQAFDIESELKPIAKLLRKSFLAFIKHIKNRTHPEVHPIYDETLFNEKVKLEGLSKKQIGERRGGFRSAMKIPGAYYAAPSPKLSEENAKFTLLTNQTGRVVLHVFYMLTGMNKSVLAPLTLSDVTFKDIGNGRYIFSGIKARADYKDVDNSVGFSKKTRDMIEDWLETSNFIYNKLSLPISGDSPFIPYIDLKGKVRDFTHENSTSNAINAQVTKLVNFTINSSRFRKTKSDILMRVTESIFLVSQGLNNTVNVVARSYSDGVKANHDNNLSAHFEAQALIAKGEDIAKAVESAKVLHSDILTEYDHRERLRRNEISTTTITPSGVRCKGASKSKLDKESKKSKNMGVSLESDEKRCTDFLSCFDCEFHVLVASEMDIWLMLSFQFQVIEMKEVAARNSTPKNNLFRIEAILHKTLERLKKKSQKAFNNAIQRLENEGYHPLYANLHSLKYFMES